MGNRELWAKMRPTAVIFALVMAALTWFLISRVLGGTLGSLAFGDGQAASVVTAGLIVVGTAVGSLGNALLKLSEDAPPQQVPETSHQELIRLLGSISDTRNQVAAGLALQTENEGNRPREGIGEPG